MDFNETTRLNIELDAELLNEIAKPPVAVAKDALANFRWQSNGLRIRSVDPSNAILVEQWIPDNAFDTYTFEAPGEELIFGTPCKTISTLLRAASGRDIVNLDLNTETDRLDIEFADVSYSLAGVNPEEVDEPDVPNLEYDVSAFVHSSAFLRACQVIGMVTDTIHFNISEEEFRITGRGDTDIAEINVRWVETKDEIIDGDDKVSASLLHYNGPIQSRYGTKFIQHLNDFTPKNIWRVRLGEDLPILIEAERARNRIEAEIMIAPKLASET